MHAEDPDVTRAFQRAWEQDPVSHIGWVITTKTDGGLVGLCDTDTVNGTSDGEVGYWMCRASWGQGFTTEAARAAVRFAFEHTTWDRMVAAVTRPGRVSSGPTPYIGESAGAAR